MSLLPVGISGEEAGYQIERSLRFNSADTAYLNRTFSTPTSQNIWSFSAWLKRGKITDQQFIFWAGTNSGNDCALYFSSTDQIGWFTNNGASVLTTSTAVFRDPSAWYHVVAIANSTTMNVYVNNQQVITNAGMTNNTVNSAISHCIGQDLYTAGNNADFYLTEINFIDGQALTPSSFGEFNSTTGVWQPKAYTGSYGTNGFYLNFSDNSGTTSTTLGKDYSGNGNNWTPNLFSVTAGADNDSLVDTPTSYGTDTGAGGEVRSNYATLNPLTPPVNGSLSNGNLLFTGATDWGGSKSTFAIPTTGKWYAEFTLGSTSSNSAQADMGIFPAGNSNGYAWAGSYGLEVNSGFFLITNGSYSANRGGATAGGTVLQIAVDADAGNVWFGVANAWYDTYNTTNGNPGAGTNPSGSSINFSAITYFMGVKTDFNNWTANFGQRPFAYTAPSGFKALCTQNLPEPTIVDGGQYFNTVLWTGTGSGTTRAITGVGFQPDWVWAKARPEPYSHSLYDVIRGGGANSELITNATSAEGGGNHDQYGYLSSFDSDGFTSTAGTLGAASNFYFNQSGKTYVAWNWKANGAGSTNTAGTITSTVSANTDSGFSIVTYTGTGANATVGHGLGVAPSMVIVRTRNQANNWNVYHSGLTSAAYYLGLNLTNAQILDATAFNSTAPTSTVFSVGTLGASNANGINIVAYCFAPVAGYSAFGSYTGNGSADGPFVYTGFRPKFLLIKNITSSADWHLRDTSRDPFNIADNVLYPNGAFAETYGDGRNIDILSNGFKLRWAATQENASGNTYIYAAFAENPFKYSLAR